MRYRVHAPTGPFTVGDRNGQLGAVALVWLMAVWASVRRSCGVRPTKDRPYHSPIPKRWAVIVKGSLPMPSNSRKPRSPRLSLHPLKAEEALAAFMRADPQKVAEEMRQLVRRQRGRNRALSKA
jgi:hypothetical protein